MDTKPDRYDASMTGSHVPPGLRRLWRVPAPTQLGRPAELDVDRVLAAALVLADRDGLPGVTLPKVAEALGVTKMALYRYVGSKDELLTLLADFAMPPPPDLDDDWRPALRRWAHGNRDVYRRHPWLAQIPFTGPPAGPHAIAWLDSALRALRGTALDWDAKVGVVVLLGGWVRQAGNLANEFADERGHRAQAEVEREYGRALVELVDPERFPEAAGMFASGVFEVAADDDSDFEFGLDIVLDGVAARIAAA